MAYLANKTELQQSLNQIIDETPIIDIHTHIYDTNFKSLLLWGIDELLTYHYLVAELFRMRYDLNVDEFWSMNKTKQAELIWDNLFIQNSPVSEACRGVVTVLSRLGIKNIRNQKLDDIRKFFSQYTIEEYVNRVFELANVKEVVMTNDPFDDLERPVWLENPKIDPRFKAALRIDPILMQWEQNACPRLRSWGYAVEADLSKNTLAEIRRFLSEWIDRMQALYMAVSLPPTFYFPEESTRGTIIKECILPVCREKQIPFAMMIGVKKLINPALKLAGDGVGKADLNAVENLLRMYPQNKFLVTLLSRENQHELCILGRKFGNLMIFGCWWFLNDPSIIEEMTRERLELLGLSFIPQHSDARVLDQLIYKWHHSKMLLKTILLDKYNDLLLAGWSPTPEEISRDVQNLFGGNFKKFLAL
ncbi:glucuronate isomerase [candidate division KSB1 bacterium]|nr:glucuronate isomerase [candidate division KSB1 bacterium]